MSEILDRRELLYFLTRRDIAVRYKQTLIGTAWVLLQPLVSTLILTIIFSAFSRFETGSVPYPAFVLSGILIWLFVYGSVTMASNSFVGNVNLVTKVYFPRLIVPLAATFAVGFDFLVGLPILAAALVYYGVSVSANLLLAPIFIFLVLVQTAGFGIMFAALNVRYRDIKFALPFFLQIWMLASPVFYPAAIIPEKWRLVFAINPLTGLVEGWRSAVFGFPFDWTLIGISSAATMAVFVLAIAVFRSMEDDFADDI